MNTEPEIITHLGISAPRHIWTMLGYYAVTNNGILELRPNSFSSNADSLIVRAKAEGHTGETAIAWALGEQTRQAEERTRSTAMAREAEALGRLAAAIRDGGEEAALERIIGRLSERTQYAVRQQLKK